MLERIRKIVRKEKKSHHRIKRVIKELEESLTKKNKSSQKKKKQTKLIRL